MINQGWALACELGFLGWVGCTIGFIFRAFGDNDAFYGRRALFWGGLVVIFYALWVLGMVRA
ncbi:MAG: hypothetical protein KAJ10_04980 [Thermodesulfovibrionia bacterium]|nr:hypothetical protein [Thermodesulfovibrionia bacterium]